MSNFCWAMQCLLNGQPVRRKLWRTKGHDGFPEPTAHIVLRDYGAGERGEDEPHSIVEFDDRSEYYLDRGDLIATDWEVYRL